MIHLVASVAVALACAALVFGAWYPMPFREISGGRDLFLIVVAVDVVLGPLLTLAVFDVRKKSTELRRDLAVVVLLQLGGLAYGLHTVFVARPVALVLESHRLRVVRAIDLDPESLAKAPAEWRRLPLWGTYVIAAREPQPGEKLAAIDMALQGVDIGMRPEFWLPSTQTESSLALAARPLEGLRRKHPQHRVEIDAAAAAAGEASTEKDVGYIPVLARRIDWVALVDRKNGRILGYLPFDGF